jgi:uncharacterized membrane protein YfcA
VLIAVLKKLSSVLIVDAATLEADGTVRSPQPPVCSDKPVNLLGRARTLRQRGFLYPLATLLVYLVWSRYMVMTDSWWILKEHLTISVTMAFGSIIAGATAEGGGAVAFPVFTKALSIPAADARTFALMIQSIGMTMAGLMIYCQRAQVLSKVIGWVLFGGVFGQILGTFFLIAPAPYPKILFTFMATAFGVALAYSRWRDQFPTVNTLKLSHKDLAIFFGTGILGGILAANVGCGIDMLTFIVLTLLYGVNEKISTPTTVIIMGFNSVVGFLLHGFILQDIGVAWEYWLAAVPIVIIGAPLGAWLAIRTSRDGLIFLLLTLIIIELVSTLWLVPFTPVMWGVTAFTLITCWWVYREMLRAREKARRVATSQQITL